PRHHVQARAELDLGLLQQGEIADAQALEHRAYMLRLALPCQPSLACSERAKGRSGFCTRFTATRSRRTATSSPPCRPPLSCRSSSGITRPNGPIPRSTSSVAGASPGGRLPGECAHPGVTTIASTSGASTGPPAEREYAVEPAAVAAIRPSATRWPRS